MFGRTEQAHKTNRKGSEMPKTGPNTHSRKRGSKVRSVHVGAPALETRSRQILATIVEEAIAEPNDLKLPDPTASFRPDVLAEAQASDQADQSEGEQPIDDLATHDLVTIAQHGASLEVDGSKYTSDELTLIAENVTDQAHLKISNSGAFSAKQLAAIAQSGAGQVILA
jgi:hypothetical protein